MEKSKNTYLKINRLNRQYLPMMILAFLSINLLGLALPLTMKKIYTTIVSSRSVDALRFVLGLALVALALEAIMRSIKESSSVWIAAKYEYLMSNFLIEKLLKVQSQSKRDMNYISNLEKFKSLARLGNYYSTAFYQVLIDVPFALIFLTLIYLYGKWLVLIPIGLSMIYVVMVYLVTNRYFKSKQQFIHYNDQMLAQLIETLEKIHFIKASGVEESQVIRYKKLLEEVTEMDFISNANRTLPKIMASRFSQLTLFSILVAGGYMLSQDMISFGQITACAMLGGRAVAPIISSMRFYQQTQDIKLLRERLDAIAEEDNQYTEDTPDFPQDIYGMVELLEVAYKDIQTEKLETFSASVEVGAFAVINPTTFPSYRRILKKIMGHEPMISGKILIDNLDIDQWNMHTLKGKIELLTEEVSIFKGSVLDNITYFRSSEIENAYEAAALTGLDNLVSKMPLGFETELDSHMLNYLSSAFLQRLNLARALLERPRILIFDRIDESMDQETLDLFLWLLNKLKGRTTILIATWHPKIQAMADQILKPEVENSSPREVRI